MKELALYIHIPFCKQKCFYCDFKSYSGKDELMNDYIEALCKEIERNNDKVFKTIFIGGGTPTYLSEDNLIALLKTINALKTSEELEFTIEGNPGTFTKRKLKILKDMGVNRLSIGVQAWQDFLLKNLGRIHTIQEFITGYELARQMGFTNINVDLMFGLPEQTLNHWEETLTNIVKLNPEHVSCYSLIIEEGTPFFNKYEEGKLTLPDEDTERSMYHIALEILESRGYNQYEISNFSLPNCECKHNLAYWELGEYIGCGVSAHSYVDGYRVENIHSIKEYIRRMNNKLSPVFSAHKNSKNDDIEEFMFMGLRKIKGISKEEFKIRFSTGIYEIYRDVIRKFKYSGLLIEDDSSLRLSPKGVEISNYILSEFILDR
ncbi:oxygen-independent coproporphyrinogen-III oxidase-like protein YqeR [Clostridium tepidiprofundi DSM 19306]|uniref:Heme chaperone HemW n=1 Tax=Clostridium tepidiprofundi DSM 19306 TaxID=1121338 RepID=A0A151B3M0_9CLOT|nr:radical SAM family heme chaperone HemW [Clostridium tepidiprofundi]KYH34518.1 oxygen-independent coproporphyrinogen-III oxidase-like protein YqeR [Clostridium tepidiprofundi DSM 19306]